MRHDFLDHSVDIWARDCEVFGPWLLFSWEGLFSEFVASCMQLLAPGPLGLVIMDACLVLRCA